MLAIRFGTPFMFTTSEVVRNTVANRKFIESMAEAVNQVLVSSSFNQQNMRI